MTSTIDNLVQRIRNFRQENGYAKFKLATLAKVPEGCLRDIDSPEWNPTISTVRKIESVIPQEYQLKTNSKKPPKKPKNT